MSENDTYDQSPPPSWKVDEGFGEHTYWNRNRYEGLSIHRVNQLFHDGHISRDEHDFLVTKLVEVPRPNSIFALASFFSSIVGWILVLSYDFYGQSYSLLSGYGRAIAMTIMAPITIVLALIALRDIKNSKNLGGTSFAAAALMLGGLTFITLVIPFWLFT